MDYSVLCHIQSGPKMVKIGVGPTFTEVFTKLKRGYIAFWTTRYIYMSMDTMYTANSTVVWLWY